MWNEREEQSLLENAFSILRFRRRGVVSFRQFVVLNVWLRDLNDLHESQAMTQPLRALNE